MSPDLSTQLPAHVDNALLALRGQRVTHKRTTAWISPTPAPRTQKYGHSRTFSPTRCRSRPDPSVIPGFSGMTTPSYRYTARRFTYYGCRAGLLGIDQILFGGCLVTQLAETSMAKLVLHALPKLVRLAKQTSGPALLWTIAFVVHVKVRFDAL